MKTKTKEIFVLVPVEITYDSAEARRAAIKEATSLYKSCGSTIGFTVEIKKKGKVVPTPEAG